MRGNFHACLRATLKWEGGWSNHPDDNGGMTMRGITIRTLSDYLGRPAHPDELKALTPAVAEDIYRRLYWDAVKGDELPAGVDLAVFDAAVNSGPSRATRWLQELVGAKQDGIVGPVTLAAVGKRSARDLIEQYSDRRMAFVRGLSDWRVFGRGWTNRINDIEDKALAMVAAAPVPTPTPATAGEKPVSKFVSKGTIAAALSVAALIAGIIGRDDVASYLGSQAAADTIFAVVTGIFAIYAGVAEGVKKDAA